MEKNISEYYPQLQLSNKIKEIPQALSIYMNQIVYSLRRKGLDIITLSLGEAYFDIPLFNFDKLNFVKGYHYSDSQGIPELRKKISDYYLNNYGVEFSSEKEILISSGSKPIIYMAIQSIINDGDEVLIHEPAWLSYQEQVKLANGIPKFIPFDIKTDSFKEYFTSKTKVVIINNPNNPAGWVYDESQLKELYEECRKQGIYLLVDEAYSDFVEKGFFSALNVSPNRDGVIVVNSLSKNMGISGWRIGYIIASENVIKNVLILNQHLLTCAPTILQLYLAEYFDEILDLTIPQAKEIVNKRKRVMKYMDSIGLSYLPGGATFYFFINISEFNGDYLIFCLYLLFKYGISVVPGSAYGKSTDSFIRVGIGAESEERLYYALDIIKDVIHSGEVNEDYVNIQIAQMGFEQFR